MSSSRFLTTCFGRLALGWLVVAGASQSCIAQEEKQEAKPEAKPEEKPAATQELVWIELAPADSGFSVELPGEPSHDKRNVKPLPEIEVEVDLYLLSLKNGKVAMVVGYHDVQEMPTTDKKRKEILDGSIKGTLVNVLGKLTNHERGELEGHKMRDFSYTGVRGRRDIAGSSKLVLVDKRVYQLSIIHLAEVDVDAEMKKRFFSSFKLTK